MWPIDIIVGHTNFPICLVTAVLDYIRLRQDTSGAFFLDRHQCLVRKTWFIQQIRSILQFLGLPEHHYAGHSFRIVAATFAVQAGLKDSTIQTLERQQSVAFLQYIRLPWTHLAHISHQLSTAALNHTTSPNAPKPQPLFQIRTYSTTEIHTPQPHPAPHKMGPNLTVIHLSMHSSDIPFTTLTL